VGVLSDLTVGDKGVLVALDLPENVQNPTVYRIDGLEIALRHETASAIQIRPIEVRSTAIQPAAAEPNVIQPAKIRPVEATAQPGNGSAHGSSIAPERGSAAAPKLAEAAR
jgi:hypothetical protein